LGFEEIFRKEGEGWCGIITNVWTVPPFALRGKEKR